MSQRVVVLSIPQLRHRDLAPGALASLEALVRRGDVADFCPAFPSLAAPAFASLITGEPPSRHGIVGDAFFDRALGRVVARPYHDSDITGLKLWERLRAARPNARSLAWFTPSLRGAAVDLAGWVEPDGRLVTTPDELAGSLESEHGAYPAPRLDPSGNPLRLNANAWILRTAAALIAREQPDLAIVRVPYLGQVARRYGPDSAEANRAVLELERVLKPFIAGLDRDITVIAVTESVSTPVEDAILPNLILRGLGLLELTAAPDGGTDIDTRASAAFAVADHQIAHIYINDPAVASTVAAAFSGQEVDGIATVAGRSRLARLGLDHPRAGDIVLVASPAYWFAPDWWVIQTERPQQPERGSGLARGASIPHGEVRGSLGAPSPSSDYHGVIVCSRPGVIPLVGSISGTNLLPVVLAAIGIS